jgi:hypothetical protein
LWAVGLANLPLLHDFEIFVGQNARLRGRNLQPWKAILSIAAWLDQLDQQHRLQRPCTLHNQGQGQVVIGGIWQRLEEMSWRYQQEESTDQQSGDLVLLVIQGLSKLAADKSDIIDDRDIPKTWTFTTTQISETTRMLAEQTEADIDTEKITSRTVGRLLGKLRLHKAREAGKGTRMWQVTTADLKRWSAVYSIPLLSDLTQENNVTHVTNDRTSQHAEPPWLSYEIEIRLPADSKFPTVKGRWQKLPDGRIEAGYNSYELAYCLSVFLGKEVDVTRINITPIPQLRERLAEVTGGEIIQIRIPEKSKRSQDE